MKAKFYALTVYLLLCLIGPVWTVLAGALTGIIRMVYTVVFTGTKFFTCSESVAQKMERLCFCLSAFPQFIPAKEAGDLPFTFVQRAPGFSDRPQFMPLSTIESQVQPAESSSTP